MNSRALAYELFELFLSGLEEEEMRAHVRRQTGEEPTEGQIDVIQDEWFAARRYLNGRCRRLQREAESSGNVDPAGLLP